MGGDDLGSDDDYYLANNNQSVILESSPNDEAESDTAGQESTTADNTSLKRKQPIQPKQQGKEDQKSSPSLVTTINNDEAATEKTKKKRRRRHKDNPLAEMGLTVQSSSQEEQAKLLTDFAGIDFHPHQVSTCDQTTSLLDRLPTLISKRKMKRWKEKQSPCVLIVCLSARRAVQILKELAPFHIRAAKLFAKHMDVETQKELLQEGAFGIAVGTPHRILALLQEESALSLKQTKLVVLDTFLNQKGFSVYTLPDTMVATKDLLQEHVHSESNKKRGVRVAFA